MLIGFLSELLAFCEKMSDLSDSLMVALFWRAHEQIAHGHSFLVSNLRAPLKLLIFW